MTIRMLTRDEVDIAVDWAADEGWNPGLHDADAFYAADPEGFLGIERDGEIIGTISAVRYGDDYGFIGFYITAAGHRATVEGGRLAQAGLARLKGRVMGVDGVLAKASRYARFAGFRKAWQNVRYQGQVDAVPRDGEGGTTSSLPPGCSLRPAGELPFEQLAAYDTRHFGARREAFLREWISLPGHQAWACVDTGGGDDEVRGFGVIRQCRVGSKIGPLFAADEVVAEALFRCLVSRAADGPIVLDTPDANPAAVALAERYGMTPVFATARMYAGGDPGLPLAQIFGVTTFELG